MIRATLVAGFALLATLGVWRALDRPEVPLGPVDGFDLPPADTGRVGVGDVAPDFTLVSRRGERMTLSELRGEKDVVLVFYRGHW